MATTNVRKKYSVYVFEVADYEFSDIFYKFKIGWLDMVAMLP